MRAHTLSTLSLMAAPLLTACGSPPISAELRTARDAYDEAGSGPAAERARADLEHGRQALERAEEAFRKDHKSQARKDYAYLAQRSAEMADIAGEIEKEKRSRKELQQKLVDLEKRHASMTREELDAAKAELANKQRLIDDQ